MFWVAVVQHFALHENHVDTRVMFVTYVPKERIPSEKIFPTLELCSCTRIMIYAGVCMCGYECMRVCVRADTHVTFSYIICVYLQNLIIAQ